jgi:hypothetical protein
MKGRLAKPPGDENDPPVPRALVRSACLSSAPRTPVELAGDAGERELALKGHRRELLIVLRSRRLMITEAMAREMAANWAWLCAQRWGDG